MKENGLTGIPGRMAARAVLVALGLRRKDELSKHFALMEGIWDAYSIYLGREKE